MRRFYSDWAIIPIISGILGSVNAANENCFHACFLFILLSDEKHRLNDSQHILRTSRLNIIHGLNKNFMVTLLSDKATYSLGLSSL